MRVFVAVDPPRGRALEEDLEREGAEVTGAADAATLAALAADALVGGRAVVDVDALTAAVREADILVLQADRTTLTADTVALCDRLGVRIVPLCATESDERLSAAFGLGPALPPDAAAWQVLEAAARVPHPVDVTPRAALPGVIAVWGPAGAPGRSTVAVELAVELARGGRAVALVDADTHAPSLALSLGLADEGPGFAAACRQGELGGLDARELTRISIPLSSGGVDVLAGINRPSRWPELSEARVAGALTVCRTWAEHTVVDVASSLERDEEIVSDLDGPRRNAATLAALRSADLVVAVASADPVGIARFLRGYTELRATVGTTRVAVVVNRLRPGVLGIDARGQVRRALDRFGGIEDVWFLPMDPRSVDAATLAARPVADVSPRSPFSAAVRRFVGEAVVPPRTAGESRERSGARDPSAPVTRTRRSRRAA
ncbi:AAA family ATPase [Microbacterium lemovicicum]|uniref:AAA family ATPase n=1 Tax=Microbacterium lemovicicum TaxID=1072463 RepID=UPI0036391963